MLEHLELCARVRPSRPRTACVPCGARYRALSAQPRSCHRAARDSAASNAAFGESIMRTNKLLIPSLLAILAIPLTFGGCGKPAEIPTEFSVTVTVPGLTESIDGIATSIDNHALTQSRKDADGDGIRDFEDLQPTVPLDTDGDGITDIHDECPEVPEDDDGFESDDGCPELDNDDDGIPDSEDNDPNVPVDADEDGLTDRNDYCPVFSGKPDDADEAWEAPEDFSGCPECVDVVALGNSQYMGTICDQDGDTIDDESDWCENLAEGENGASGCPVCVDVAAIIEAKTPYDGTTCPDADGDGVYDKDDQCPALDGDDDSVGCPECIPEDERPFAGTKCPAPKPPKPVQD